MRIRCLQNCFLSAIALLLILPMSAGFAYGQQGTPAGAPDVKSKADFSARGQRDARAIKYGDWQKFCFKTPEVAQVCRTTISGKWETGQSAVRIDLIEREGESAARLQLYLPVGLYLQAGARLTVDPGEPFQIPYVWCLTNACIAADRADPVLVRQMETGQQLRLEVVDTNLQRVSTTLPLDQFASIHKAPASRTFTQEIDE